MVAHEEVVQGQIKKIRALIQAGRERVSVLAPAWGAHLAGETMRRLGEAIDELEKEIAVARSSGNGGEGER